MTDLPIATADGVRAGASSGAGGASGAVPTSRPASRIGVTQFVPIAIQVGLVLAVAILFRIELDHGFGTVATLIFGGFVVHAWLPERMRVPFFLMLSMAAIVLLLRTDAVWLVALGLGLFGLCHLPFPWGVRVALVGAAGGALAVVQAGVVAAPWGGAVLPVLAAMFMFRIILYLYDLKNDRTPASPWQRLAYFFLLPNISFPLFPVVDYKTFLRTYYNAPAAEIYQKGVYWMLRGISHLLLYRLLYYALPVVDTQVTGVLGVFLFMAMTYGLYLRVSGLFHLIVGSLCLFGFNLPPTNHYYFLSASFSDLWRRINIYWRDFMMTTVFYPVFMKFRRGGMSRRLMSAVAAVIFVTWFLHAYQVFWLQGVFLVTGVDVAFWSYLGVMLAISTEWEARRGRRRVAQRVWSWKEAVDRAAKTVGFFTMMAVGWSLWSSSFSEWWYLILRATESEVGDWILLAGLLLGAVLVGVAGQWLGTRGWGLSRVEKMGLRYAPVVVTTASVALLLVRWPAVHEPFGPYVVRAVNKAQATGLNWIDMERQERGYYETVSRSAVFGPGRLWAQREQRDDELGVDATPASARTDDVRAYVLLPDADVVYKGARFQTNGLGLRDREYDRPKPPGVYRVALLGSSYEMGSGVENEETFENVLESRLNRELAGRDYERYEILNFAVGGYGDLQTLYVAERVVPEFEPDVVMYFVHPGETWRIVEKLRYVLDLGAELDSGHEYIAQILEEAGAHAGLPPREFSRRLLPYRDELLRWAYRRKVAACRSYGALPVFVFLPLTTRDFEPAEQRRLLKLVRDAGGVPMILGEPFRGIEVEQVKLTTLDHHPNALGHRLIADRLYTALLENADTLQLFRERAVSAERSP